MNIERAKKLKGIYILGGLGYHKETIIEPIRREITDLRFKNNLDFGLNLLHTSDSGNVWDFHLLDENYLKELKFLIEKIKQLRYNEHMSILVTEFWNQAIMILRYYIDSLGKKNNIKLTAIHHGSSHIDGDLMGGFGWARLNEDGWISCLDTLFVGSHYAKDEIIKKSLSKNVENIVSVSYLPLPDGYPSVFFTDCTSYKEFNYKIVFPHRFSKDKNCDSTVSFIKSVCDSEEYESRDIEFLVCSPDENDIPKIKERFDFERKINHRVMIKKLTRDELKEEFKLATHVYSNVHQETFGYGVMEGVLNGCIPILNELPVYKEFYDSKFIHKHEDMFTYKCLLNSPIDFTQGDAISRHDKLISKIGNSQNRIAKELIF